MPLNKSRHLDIGPLVNTTARLREGLARHEREPADEQLRDGLMQRFEYARELCHRFLRRFLRQTAASPDEAGRMAFQEVIRSANQQGLLVGDWPVWHRYRDSANRRSGVPAHHRTRHGPTAGFLTRIWPDGDLA